MRHIHGVEVYWRRKKKNTVVSGIIKVVLLFIVFYLFITHFFISSCIVESSSMHPALQKGDRIFSSPILYGPAIPFIPQRIAGIQKPHRGDVVVIIPPYYTNDNIFLQCIAPFIRFFTFQRASIVNTPGGRRISRHTVKRIIGLPGDVVMMRQFKAYIKPAGSSDFTPETSLIKKNYAVTIDKDYFVEGWNDSLPFSGDTEPMFLGEDQYFVLGDNRTSSSDSRSWGPISFFDISAKTILRYWPLNKFGPP
ncbi:MAG: signal peptidase I [Spirochaetales bacterium]|nr:signal peptidase I [Spirochaetales bacterium]